jgi:hypothetical protein
MFFTRLIPVNTGPGSSDIRAQVELALESIAPFPLNQLYYGWFARPGGAEAFVFAAYRRRFTADQVAAAEGAELVIPGFAALFGAEVEPSTTVIMREDEGLTAVHWDDPTMPSKVLFRPLAPEADDEERARVRRELLTSVGGTKAVIDLDGLPIPDASKTDREIVFRSGDFVSQLPVALTSAFDVRDKGELVAMRHGHQRDLVLWRVALGCVLALFLLALGEFAILGSRAWQSVRVAKLNAQKPVVAKIMSSQELANRIEDLATKQLMPLEMLTELVGPNLERKPPEIQFTRIQTDKTRLYSVVIDAQTTNAAQMSVYEATIKKLPSIENVEFIQQPSRNEYAIFRIVATFKPGALKPTTS